MLADDFFIAILVNIEKCTFLTSAKQQNDEDKLRVLTDVQILVAI